MRTAFRLFLICLGVFTVESAAAGPLACEVEYEVKSDTGAVTDIFGRVVSFMDLDPQAKPNGLVSGHEQMARNALLNKGIRSFCLSSKEDLGMPQSSEKACEGEKFLLAAEKFFVVRIGGKIFRSYDAENSNALSFLQKDLGELREAKICEKEAEIPARLPAALAQELIGAIRNANQDEREAAARMLGEYVGLKNDSSTGNVPRFTVFGVPTKKAVAAD